MTGGGDGTRPKNPGHPGRVWREALLVLILVAVGGVVRYQVAARTFPVSMMGDERYYSRVSYSIARWNKHYHDGVGGPAHAWRPPAQAWALAQVTDLDLRVPESQWPLVRLQVILGTALVGATWLLGRALFDGRVGLIAAGATALSPTLIAFSHYLWSEPLFAVLITVGLALIAFQRRRSSWTLAVAAGVVLGAAALTRELAIGVAGVGAFWVWLTAPQGNRWRALLTGTAMLVATAAVVLPWTLRNQEVLGKFVPVATVGWFATAEGNILDEEDWLRNRSPEEEDYRRRYFAIPDELRRAQFARRFGRKQIREEQPAWIFKKLVRSSAMLLSPDSFLFEKLRRGSYPEQDPARVKLIVWWVLAFYGAALLLGTAGLAVAGDWQQRSLAWMVLGSVLLVHVLANASTRFRIPWWPLVFVYAAQLVAHPRVLVGDRKWRWIAAVVVVSVLASLLAPGVFESLGPLLGDEPAPAVR